MQQLRDDQLAHAIVNRPGNKDDPFFQKTGENIIGPFPARGLLNDHGNEVHIGIDWIFHSARLFWESLTVFGQTEGNLSSAVRGLQGQFVREFGPLATISPRTTSGA